MYHEANVPSQLFVKGNEEGYIIEASHNPTASFNGDVYAILLSQPPAERWIITEQPQHGRDVYTYVHRTLT